MGFDPLSMAMIAMSVASAGMSMSNAKSEAKAVTKQATLDAKNKAIQTTAKAASQKTSFLTSGFTLEGTPMSVLESTYSTGKEDINQIISNANTQSKNIMSSARSKAMQQIAGSFMGSGMGSSMMNSASAGMTNMMSTSMASYMPDSFLYSANLGGAGNNAYSAFDMKDSRF